MEDVFARVEEIEDPAIRGLVAELVTGMLEMYGEGLHRIFAALDEAGSEVTGLRRRLLDDGVVASLLLIHDLYPEDLEDRIRRALDEVRPYMESHGGDIELLDVEGGVARLRLEGSCDGCPSSATTLELAVKEALRKEAPDLAGIEVEGAAGPESPAEAPVSDGERPAAVGNGSGRRSLPIAGYSDGASRDGRAVPSAPRWVRLDGLDLAKGTVAAAKAGNVSLIVANVDGTLLAYRDGCAACGASLETGALEGTALGCPRCAERFDLPDVGRSLESESLRLEPVPLLREDGAAVRVGVPT